MFLDSPASNAWVPLILESREFLKDNMFPRVHKFTNMPRRLVLKKFYQKPPLSIKYIICFANPALLKGK